MEPNHDYQGRSQEQQKNMFLIGGIAAIAFLCVAVPAALYALLTWLSRVL